VEHPQIVAGGEQLRQLSANGGNAAAFLATASEIIRLLDMHFGKEEQILFPMAASMLDDETLASLGRQMETLK
jgi:hemerythrin-like domain-containing protein